MKINVKTVGIFLLLFPFVPILLSTSDAYMDALIIIKAAIGMAGFAFLIPAVKKHPWLLGLLATYCTAFFLPFLIGRQADLRELVLHYYPFGFFLILIYLCDFHSQSLIHALSALSMTVVALYLVYFFFYLLEGKLDQVILYNNRNAIQTYMTFVVGGLLLRPNYEKRRLNGAEIFGLAIAFAAMAASGSATTVFTLAAGLFVLLCYKKISYFLILAGYTVLTAVIVIYHQVNNPIVQAVLALFQKSSTFTSRTWRWQFVFEEFRLHPMFGSASLEAQASAFANYAVDYFNPHNALLYILAFSGIFGLLAVGVLFFLAFRRAASAQEPGSGGFRDQYFKTVVTMVLVTGLMESNISPGSMVMNLFIILSIVLFGNRRKEAVTVERNPEKIPSRYIKNKAFRSEKPGLLRHPSQLPNRQGHQFCFSDVSAALPRQGRLRSAELCGDHLILFADGERSWRHSGHFKILRSRKK